MGDVITLKQPTLKKSTFDLEFQDERLVFDIGYENNKVVFFWYEEGTEEADPKIVYEKEVSLNKLDRFLDRFFGRDSRDTLKKKTLRNIRKAINEFRQTVILQENMSDLVTEIMDAGQVGTSQIS